MIDHIRRFLLLIGISFICLCGYYIYKNFSIDKVPLTVKLTSSGADIKIENFKIIHENSGKKEWELSAKLAQINHSKKSTNMQGVKVEYSMQNKQKFWVSAESGLLNTETKDFELMGNVHFVAESASIAQNFLKKQTSLNP